MKTGYLLKMIAILPLGLFSGCEGTITPSTPPATGTCGTGVAQIAVGDGYLEVLCGCTQADGTVYSAGNPLTCNVSSTGTYVFFQYVGSAFQHQIISTGGPGFATSPLFDPTSVNPIKSHTVQLNTSGTYPFEDAINTALSGQIIAP